MGCTSRVNRIETGFDARLVKLVSAAEVVNVTARMNPARKLFPQILLVATGFTVVALAGLVQENRVDVGTMDGRVTAGGPASAELEVGGVWAFADENFRRQTRALHLRVAAEAEIVVGLREHHAVDRTVRVVTGRAAFAQGGMFEDKGPSLLAMALGAVFIAPGHGQASRQLEDVFAVRVVALRAIHAAFSDGMMRGQLKFRLRLQMTAEAGVRVPSGIDDEFADAAANLDVFATRTVAGFAAGAVLQGRVFKIQMRMRAGFKSAGDVGMALEAGVIADVMRAGDFEWRDRHARHGGTRIEKQNHTAGDTEGRRHGQCALRFQWF